MYRPRQFDIRESEEIDAFIRAHSFGQLLTTVDGKIAGSYLPWLYDAERGVLTGHLARVNPQLDDLEGAEVLVTLEGPHGYISPTWYAKPGVPTWNYQAVHVYGLATCFDEAARLNHTVEALSHEYEQNQETPWQPNYPGAMLNAIVGVEIKITELQAKYKLSQNRTSDEVENVCQQLEAGGEHALALAMRRQRSLSKK